MSRIVNQKTHARAVQEVSPTDDSLATVQRASVTNELVPDASRGSKEKGCRARASLHLVLRQNTNTPPLLGCRKEGRVVARFVRVVRIADVVCDSFGQPIL